MLKVRIRETFDNLEKNDPDDQIVIQDFLKNNPEFQDDPRIKKLKKPLNQKQREELLKIAYETNYKHGLMIETQLYAGLRVNELVNLTVNQIDCENKYITIQSRKASKNANAFRTKTLSSNRRVPITKELSDKLKAFIADRKTGYVFESRKSGPLSKNSVINFIDDYGLKCKSIKTLIGSHALRRTYASYLISQNIPVADISKLLGHSSVRTTMLYLFDIEGVDESRVRKALNKMNKRGKKGVEAKNG